MSLIRGTVSGAADLLTSYPDVLGELLCADFPGKRMDKKDMAVWLVSEILIDPDPDWVDCGISIRALLESAVESGAVVPRDLQRKVETCADSFSRFSGKRVRCLRDLLLYGEESEFTECRDVIRELDNLLVPDLDCECVHCVGLDDD